MAAETMKLESKSHDAPEESRRPEKTAVDIVTVGGHTVGRFRFQPGWSWAECIKPVAKTDSCQGDHLGYCIAGSLEVQTDDGQRAVIKSGESYHIPPGHNAWVTGSDGFEGLEFMSAATYAKPS